jgi:hypothetical protein
MWILTQIRQQLQTPTRLHRDKARINIAMLKLIRRRARPPPRVLLRLAVAAAAAAAVAVASMLSMV